jgi:DNA topoisomerase IA
MNGLDEALKDVAEGRVSKPMTIKEFKTHLDKVWQEAENEI